MRRTSAVPWAIVALIGVALVVFVLGIGLVGRLVSGQDLLDDAAPAFTADRAAGARGGIDIVSQITDFSEPVAAKDGQAVSEVPKLVGLVSKKTGLSQAQVLAALKQEAPHTTALLQSVPLSDVTAELPQLITLLSKTLKLSPAQVQAALKENFPALNQTVTALPKVTDGYWNVPDTQSFTDFSGTPVRSIPAVRDYFSDDLIPVVESQSGNLTDLTKRGGIGFLGLLLLALGVIVAIFGVVMAVHARRGAMTRGQAKLGWGVVTAVGVIVVLLVVGLNLFPRLSGGNDVLETARPAFELQRVEGARAGINIISDVADLTEPITRPSGGAAGEVPKLVAYVSKETGLSQAQVLAALQQNVPKTTALLQSLPLSSVSAELPGLTAFLAKTLDVTPAQLNATLKKDFPGLTQVITALPKVTSGYDNVPGTEKLTRFDGAAVNTVPEVRDYFSDDVIPVLERQQAHFQDLDDPGPPVNVFAPLLLIVGLAVTAFGIVMLIVVSRRGDDDGSGTGAPGEDRATVSA